MPFPDGATPSYVQQTPEQAAAALAAVLQKLKLYENPRIRAQKTSGAKKSEEINQPVLLEVNGVSEEELSKTLIKVRGVGPVSINKIIASRAVNGDFLSPQDFDRRVKGVRYERLQAQCEEANITISLNSSGKAGPYEGGTARDRGECHRPSTTGLEEASTLCITSWNSGRMSRHSAFYEEKLQHLLRFVSSSGVDVLLIQELCRGVLNDLRERMANEFNIPWDTYEDAALAGDGADCSLGLLYRSDRAAVAPVPSQVYREIGSILSSFQRHPQLVLIRLAKIADSKALATIHIHASQSNPRPEIEQLGDIAKAIETVMVQEHVRDVQSRPITLIAGDFNLNSDSLAFNTLRKRRFVETVQPPGATSPHPFTTLDTTTTAGGQWFDNFWIPARARRLVTNAWCFDFGGPQKKLDQSSHEFATERRCRSSDHLPVAIKMRLAKETKRKSHR